MRVVWPIAIAGVIACGTIHEAHYTATYSDTGSWIINRMAVEAIEMQGYKIASAKGRLHDFLFITYPVRTDPNNPIEAAFMVQIVFELETRGRKRFTVSVFPRAF